MEKRKISRKKSGKGGREGSARNFSKIIEMSRSNFSNCKNPDAVVQCAVRIDRASPEGGEGQACCTCRLHEEGEREGRGEWGIRWRSHGSDADTKTKPRQGRARRGAVQVPVRRKSNTQVSLFTSLPPPANRNSTCERQFDPRHFWVADPVGGRGRA